MDTLLALQQIYNIRHARAPSARHVVPKSHTHTRTPYGIELALIHGQTVHSTRSPNIDRWVGVSCHSVICDRPKIFYLMYALI